MEIDRVMRPKNVVIKKMCNLEWTRKLPFQLSDEYYYFLEEDDMISQSSMLQYHHDNWVWGDG